MVKFENITIKGEYIYALETDMMTGVSCNIKLHVKNEWYSHDGKMTGSMIKALWGLQRDYNKKGKLRKTEVIAWG